MPVFADATQYLKKLKMAGNNSSLSTILQAIGVKCSPCMQSALRSKPNQEARQPYYAALGATAEQIKAIEEALKPSND
jgi:hypothetical protein